MKVDLKMETKGGKEDAGFFKKGLSGRKQWFVFPHLPSSVNPLFRMAHCAQSFFNSAPSPGGEK